MTLEHLIVIAHFVDEFEHVGKTRAARGANTQADTLALAAPFKRALHMLSCRRSEEHTSELQSLMRISYAVFCLNKKKCNYFVYHLYSHLICLHTSYLSSI